LEEQYSMVLELIYTSAPKTLDGAGYGVVAKSEGLPSSLERFIQQFNRYDFDLSAENGKESTCPAVFSHATFRDGADEWHLMSRVGVGGIDYTNRRVFLAHHVAVTGDELDSATIGGLMRNRSMFHSVWDGRLGEISPRTLPASVPASHVRGVWDTLAGDRDWAKVWIERSSRRTGNPCFVVVPGEADVLGLFTEAMALMSPSDARQVSFITQMIADREGVNFDWIALKAGSTLARNAATRFPDRTLDLTRPIGVAPTTVPRHSQASKANPTRPAAAATRRSVSPVDTATNFDEYAIVDTAPVNRERSIHTPIDPSSLPPPPPPPRFFENRYVATLLFIASIAIMSVSGATAWRLGAFGPTRQKTDFAPQLVQTQKEDTPEHDKPPDLAPHVVGEIQPTYPNEPAVAIATTTPAPASPSPVLKLKRWLVDTLSKAAAGTWVTVLEIEEDDKHLVPPSPYLRLLTSKASGLESTQLPPDQGEGGIEVSSREGHVDSVKIRLRDGHILEVLQAENLNHDLLDRLAYCVLEIRSRLEGLKTSQIEFRPARVTFTPDLPAVPFSKMPWTIDKSLDSGAKAFFKMTDRLQKRDLRARIRVHCVTLSFLPGNETGWTFAHSKEKPAESALEQKLVRTLELALPDGKWPVSLSVTTHFDRTDRAESPIETQFVDPRPSSKQKVDEKPDEGYDAAQLKPIFDGSTVKKGAGGAGAEPSNRRRTPNAAKQAKKDAVETKVVMTLEQSMQISETLDSHAFMLELFRRFGLLHCSIVVRVQNESSEEDVEILRFSKVQIVTHP
jgi:hypothetical protein